jgi:hypothetical protein
MDYATYQQRRQLLPLIEDPKAREESTGLLEADYHLGLGVSHILMAKTGKAPDPTVVNRLVHAIQVIGADSREKDKESQARVQQASQTLAAEL